MAFLTASRARSTSEAKGPKVHCAVGEPAAAGCGCVGTAADPFTSLMPRPPADLWSQEDIDCNEVPPPPGRKRVDRSARADYWVSLALGGHDRLADMDNRSPSSQRGMARRSIRERPA